MGKIEGNKERLKSMRGGKKRMDVKKQNKEK
jgi:hypothetical protein